MLVEHVVLESWPGDTNEAGKVQPSHVIGLGHLVTLEPEDVELLRGPAGADGAQGIQGPAGADGPVTQSILPAGMIGAFRRTTAPAGWLAMTGFGVLVANYPELLDACYVGDADNETAEGFYRCNAADGSGRSVTGDYLFIEDMRDNFIRGWSSGGARKVGNAQAESVKLGGSILRGTAITKANWAFATGSTAGGSMVNLASVRTDGVETVPKNRAYLVCVSTGGAV